MLALRNHTARRQRTPERVYSWRILLGSSCQKPAHWHRGAEVQTLSFIKRLAILSLLVIAVPGCSYLSVPRPALPPQGATTIEVGPNSAPIGANGPLVGVNLYARDNYTAAQVKTDGQRMMSYIRNVLHSEAVDIVWNFYSPGTNANTIDTTHSTLSAANVAILTKIARKYHLLIEYRPLIVVQNGNPWEGYISPTNPVAWFDSYYTQELPYLRIAQRYGVDEFIAATELAALNDSPYWLAYFTRIQEVYHGVISYAAEESDYFSSRESLLPVRFVGFDMYHPLDLPPSASTAQVTKAYESFFTQIPASVLRRTAIDETGIAARVGAYQKPPFLYLTGSIDEEVQANWFMAACQTVKKYEMRAVFFWKVDLTDYPIRHPASSLSTFEGRQGAQAIARCASIING
jgi:hypothetical protein